MFVHLSVRPITWNNSAPTGQIFMEFEYPPLPEYICPCHQQETSTVHYTTSCKHSLVLLRMGEIIARNVLSWLKATSTLHYTTSCKHSPVLLRMGEVIARNMLSWLKLLINCYCCICLVVYTIVSEMHGHTNIKSFEKIQIPLKILQKKYRPLWT